MPLPADEIRRRLPMLDGWEFDGQCLKRGFQWPTFAEAIRFVDQVAVLAEEANHHPDIDIRYTLVRLALVTHSDGGVTDKDFDLAARINRISPRP